MKKIIITYGLISGAIVAAIMLGSIPLWKNNILTFDNGEYVGYTTMVIALSLIFFGTKSYRDTAGSLTFGQGVKIGLLISLIASVMYALAWEVSYNFAMNDFISQYTEHYLNGLKTSGASETEIKEATESMATMSELYKNPLIRFGMTIMEILPVGIIITLISAALLRRKEFLPAEN